MIGIICETKEEVDDLREDMDDPLIQEKAGMTFISGELKGQQITAVCTNNGKVNNAVCAQILLGEMDADLLIAMGSGRGLAPDLEIGDIILVKETAYFDVDASALGYQLGEVIGIPDSEFEADDRLLVIAGKACEKVLAEDTFREGNTITGDRIVTDSEEQKHLHILWDADCIDMEGAAIAQVAFLHHKPWIILRAISGKPASPVDELEEPFEESLDNDEYNRKSFKDADITQEEDDLIGPNEKDSLLYPDDEDDLLYPNEDMQADDSEDFLYFREMCIENFSRILREMLNLL